jgi:hypothetical protein
MGNLISSDRGAAPEIQYINSYNGFIKGFSLAHPLLITRCLPPTQVVNALVLSHVNALQPCLQSLCLRALRKVLSSKVSLPLN